MEENLIPSDEMIDLLRYWRDKNLSNMRAVIGFVKLLLEEDPKLGSLTPHQRNFLEVVLRNAEQSKEWWNIAVEYTQFCNRVRLPEMDKTHLTKILDEVELCVGQTAYVSTLEIFMPDNLPAIKANVYLSTAISYLILPQSEKYYLSGVPFSPRITVSEPNNGFITFKIWTDLRNLKAGDEQKAFYPGGHLATAKLIIEQYYGELIVNHQEQGVEFQFSVPEWKE